MSVPEDNNIIQISESLVFDTEKCTALLSIEPLDSVFEKMYPYAERLNVLVKPEFHLTLIGFAVGRSIKTIVDQLQAENQAKVTDFLVEQLGRFDWQYSARSEFYTIEKKYQFRNQPAETRTAIIQLVDLPDLVLLYDTINDIFSEQFAAPFPHVTLYTNSTNRENQHTGIGVNSQTEFEAMRPERLV